MTASSWHQGSSSPSMAWYAKVLVPENELLRPDPAKMNPKTKELFQLLFPHFFQPDEPPTGAV
jgi:hypothetical protein